MFTHSDNIANIADALAKAQSEYRSVVKYQEARAGSYSYTYADFATCLDAIRPALNKYNISVVQAAATDGEKVTVTTLLMHASGEWISSALAVHAENESIQKLGSAISYARRYAFLAITGSAAQEDDDDGAAAMVRKTPPPATARPHKTPVEAFPAPVDTPKAPYPEKSAQEAGEALRAAIQRRAKAASEIGKGPATNRKGTALEYMLARFGAASYRAAIAHVVGRTFPVDDEIKMSMTELEKLEAWVIAEEASATEKDRA